MIDLETGCDLRPYRMLTGNRFSVGRCTIGFIVPSLSLLGVIMPVLPGLTYGMMDLW